MAAKWAAPPDIPISTPCHDLLRRLLVADPAQRLTMAQISAHPWFTTNLPADALAMNDDCLRATDYTGELWVVRRQQKQSNIGGSREAASGW